MSTYKERLIDEQAQLNQKVEKLEVFILSENFQKIEAVQKPLLKEQLIAMKNYNRILIARIAYLQ